MSNADAFHMEGSASWTQLRYFSPLYLPRFCHGCPLANTMKRNSRSIVQWCTWLLMAACWFTHSCWHHFYSQSECNRALDETHKQQHLCVSIPGEKPVVFFRSNQFHISFKGKSNWDRTFFRHLWILELNQQEKQQPRVYSWSTEPGLDFYFYLCYTMSCAVCICIFNTGIFRITQSVLYFKLPQYCVISYDFNPNSLLGKVH